jgi:hypothetical protein
MTLLGLHPVGSCASAVTEHVCGISSFVWHNVLTCLQDMLLLRLHPAFNCGRAAIERVCGDIKSPTCACLQDMPLLGLHPVIQCGSAVLGTCHHQITHPFVLAGHAAAGPAAGCCQPCLRLLWGHDR